MSLAADHAIPTRPKRRRYQYSLRTLVIVVTLCAIGSFVWRRELAHRLLPNPNPITVVSLKYARADIAADLLNQLFSQNENKVRISIDRSSNSLFVQADAKQTETVKGVIQRLDRYTSGECFGDSRLRLFHLVNADAKQCVTELRTQFGPGVARFGCDEYSNSVVMIGNEKILGQAEQVLQTRDEPRE